MITPRFEQSVSLRVTKVSLLKLAVASRSPSTAGRGRPLRLALASIVPQASATCASMPWIRPRNLAVRSWVTQASSSSLRTLCSGSRRIPSVISPRVRQLMERSSADCFSIQRTTFRDGDGFTSSDRTFVSRRYFKRQKLMSRALPVARTMDTVPSAIARASGDLRRNAVRFSGAISCS